jgi:hypothetical protein
VIVRSTAVSPTVCSIRIGTRALPATSGVLVSVAVRGRIPVTYTSGAVAAAGIIGFGAGIAVGAMMSGGCCGWGYSSWNCNWSGGAAVYHGGAYYGNSAWHGGYYGSSASAYGAYGSAHASSGYNPSTGTYARGASTSTAYGTQKVGQAYNPYTGALWRNTSRFQCVFELGKLDGLEERPDC